MSFIKQESREIRKTILSFLKWILIDENSAGNQSRK